MASSDSNAADVTPDQQVRIYSAYESFKHNGSLAVLVAAPILIAVPPRKLDLYTFSLMGAFVASVNQLTVERTGRGLLMQFAAKPTSRVLESQRLQPPQVQETRRLLEEKAGVPDGMGKSRTGATGPLEAKAKEIWMGGETEGWKERRLREEQEKLSQGEGYGGMIMDQIWEVWNQGEKKAEELKKEDEKVVMQQTKEERRKLEFPEIGK